MFRYKEQIPAYFTVSLGVKKKGGNQEIEGVMILGRRPSRLGFWGCTERRKWKPWRMPRRTQAHNQQIRMKQTKRTCPAIPLFHRTPERQNCSPLHTLTHLKNIHIVWHSKLSRILSYVRYYFYPYFIDGEIEIQSKINWAKSCHCQPSELGLGPG